MANKDSKGILLTTKFYRSANGAALLAPKKWKLEGKLPSQLEWISVKKQEKTTTKQIAMQKIHANKLHVKLGHTGEDKMRTTIKHLH